VVGGITAVDILERRRVKTTTEATHPRIARAATTNATVFQSVLDGTGVAGGAREGLAKSGRAGGFGGGCKGGGGVEVRAGAGGIDSSVRGKERSAFIEPVS
jgi:hypothetical protein